MLRGHKETAMRTLSRLILGLAIGIAVAPPRAAANPLPGNDSIIQALPPLFYAPYMQALSGTAAAGLSATTTNATGGSFLLGNNSLTTGTGFEFSHTTSVIADGGSLARFGSTSVDTGGATHGTLLDLSSTSAPGATLMELVDTGLTTGRGIFATHTTGVLTTGSLVRLTNTTVDTGTAQGTLLDLNSTGCAACTVAQLSANALTTGIGFAIPHTTSVIADGGSLARITSTSIDTGGSTHGTLLDISASGSVASTLVEINASTASQTTETALAVTQSVTTTGYTGNFVSFTGSSTTGTGNLFALTSVNTTNGSAELITANAATTSTAGVLGISATGLTTGKGIVFKGGTEASTTNAYRALSITDSANNENFGVGVDSHIVEVQATVPVVSEADAGGSAPGCANCTDQSGTASYTTAAATSAIVVTFHTAYANAPVCVVTPANAAMATDMVSGTIKPYVTATGSALSITPQANWAANAKVFQYACFGR
jgi:hypothetical protein